MSDIMKYIASFLLFAVIFVPSIAHGETVLRIGEDISVDDDQVVDGDYYVSVGPFGNTTMSGSVKEDMFAFGGTVTANGSIGHDLAVLSQFSHVYATVTDDVRIVAREVVIADHVGGDVFVIAGSLRVLSTATIDGDIIFFGGVAQIDGKVGGSVLGTSEKIRIDSEVAGNVDVKAATDLTLGDKANIGGFVRFASLQPLVRSQNATIEGQVTESEYGVKTIDIKTQTRYALFLSLVTLFATLSLYLLFRKELQVLVGIIAKAPVKSTVLGLGVLVLGPIVALLLMFTLLGALVGVMALCVVLLAYVAGYALSGVVFGAYLAKLFTRHLKVSLVWVIIGTVVINGLSFVPVLGIVLIIILCAMAIGGFFLSIYRMLT